ncbi:hypothetical protein [Mycolicibacterium lutetiense]|uniref:Secreted protein n=1 Tax=Mycolicibacterium lutetiense TaxID=1641992 RepID=A0ABS4ZL66_9MYCO|nr:hypothetical protein [Mycolicibacterium lutetiense]MBP2450160.1 hypothetical protein [Mycolicibacterium lutetiense]
MGASVVVVGGVVVGWVNPSPVVVVGSEYAVVVVAAVVDGSGTVPVVGVCVVVGSVWVSLLQATANTAAAVIAASPMARPTVVDPRFITASHQCLYDGGKFGDVAREYRATRN